MKGKDMKERRGFVPTRKVQGFTLLEILLVIGVLGVLVLLGMRLLQGQSKQAGLERAGQELQSVMQAAIYYHSVNHAWPAENSEESCSSEQSDTQFSQYYLPKNAVGQEEKSSFGTYYCWQEHPVDEGSTQGGALFDLYLPITGSDACQTAKKVASMVPNSHAVATIGADSSEDCNQQTQYFVRSQVVPSAQSVQEASGQEFRALGECVPDASTPDCSDDLGFSQSGNSCCHVAGSSPTQYKIHFPACSAGQVQKIVYLPAFITLMHSPSYNSAQTLFDRDYVYSSASSTPTESRSRNPDPSCYAPSSESTELVCSLTVGVGMNTASGAVVDLTNPVSPYIAGSVGAVYVASCINQQGEY
jgi:prepilin-type N-terminal cleavage/methylation domain-containing protein